uniref:GDT1 family protein n=1 Tax=Oryza punctata TaxID=4537 RepID=A0A0E0JFP9_ORYPU
MASVSSSTVFASSLPHHRTTTRAPRPSLRPPPRRVRLPGRSVVSCLPKWGSEKLVVTRASDEEGPPEAAGRARGGRAWPSLDASSCGFALAAVAGVLMLQGSEQALAGTGTEFMGMQDVLGDLGDISTGFASAFLLIFFSELGDRTFFIAGSTVPTTGKKKEILQDRKGYPATALLAARNSGAIIFLGTFGALAVMTIISVVLGRAFHYVDGIIPFSFGGTDFPVDDFLAACLLVYYGVTTLLDAASGDEEKMNEEQEEAELAVSKFLGNGAGIISVASTIASTFVLVFIAEWGDKSFFSTIALAAASSPLGVIAGSLAGHAVATLIAVLGGSLLGTFLSEKSIVMSEHTDLDHTEV